MAISFLASAFLINADLPANYPQNVKVYSTPLHDESVNICRDKSETDDCWLASSSVH
jgi:hypothetical protein